MEGHNQGVSARRHQTSAVTSHRTPGYTVKLSMGEIIIALNTCGFSKNHQTKIQKLVDHYRPMTFIANEHRTEDLDKLTYGLYDYKLASAFTATDRHRGTAVFIRDDVRFKARPDLDSHAVEAEFEVASADIPSANLTVVGHYRSPSCRSNAEITKYNRRLERFLMAAQPGRKYLVIAGDFNVDTSVYTSTKDVLKSCDMQFNVRSATHDAGRCLDNFATNFQPFRSQVMTNKMSSDISDHWPIMLEL